MKITGININGFGKLKNKAISFTDGVNVVYGKNEAGKSTTHTFIKSMLFGMKKKKSKSQLDTFSKYFPWDTNGRYEGTLSFTYGDKAYQIYRAFSETNPILEIREIGGNGTTIKNPEAFLSKVLYNLNIDSFENTISIAQLKSAQDSSVMIDNLHKYIANLNTSGNMSINTMSAINYLKQKKDLLLMKLKSDATMLYNKQLGNIRNIEKELSNKSYENKMPLLLSQKSIDSKKISQNNDQIEQLKKEVVEDSLTLDNFGFASRDDIDSLSLQANKIFIEYSPIMDKNKQKSKLIFNVLMILFGIIIFVFDSLLLVVTYPDIASILSIYNVKYSLNHLTNFIVKLPFHPIILITSLLMISLILIIGNIILLVSNYQGVQKSNEIRDILSEIFKQHINDDEVTASNMKAFKKHMHEMKKISKRIEDDEAKIVLLTKENNELLNKQTTYDDEIKSQQRIQFDVEQKYTELYNLKIESEKMKQTLTTNDALNRDIESIDLAIETLNSLSDEIQVMFGTHLNKSVSKYIETLTKGKYNSLNVDNGLNVTINYEGKIIPLNKISTGTADQVYLAMRLAVSDIVRGSKEALPLLFDDCFAMYDNERLESALKFLNDGVDSQVIIFSCHTRERALLSHNNIDFNSIDIEQI